MPQKKDKFIIIRGKFRGGNAEFEGRGGDDTFTVCFNPSEYTISKKTNYAEATIPGLDSPILQFNRGEARTLSVELLLDTYTYDDGGDVRQLYLEKLESFLRVDGDLHAPPPCKVVWGTMEFVGLLETLNKRFVLFLDDGTPVRARVTLGFKEYVPVSLQIAATPRSSPDRRKVHTLKSGEALWQLAYAAYADAGKWRVIADANEIANPRQVAPGTQLVIPPLPTEESVFGQ